MKAPILHPLEQCDLSYPEPVEDCYGFFDHLYEIWSNCREYGQIYLAEKGRCEQRICYAFNPVHYQQDIADIPMNIARWFWYLEGHMGWEENERTRIHPSQYDNVVVVHFADGWFQNDMAISLATLMLRIAPYCHHGALMDEVIGRYRYIANTKSAIYRFLQGYQYYTGWVNNGMGYGWAVAFGDKSCDITRLLIRRSTVVDLAYQIWQERGSPEDDGVAHWCAACERVKVPRP